jgi:hypothetical protein
MTSDQFKAHGEAVLEDLVAGLTEEEAAQKRDIAPRTIRYWLQRGRKAPYGPYGEFAKAVHTARRERRLPPGDELPLDRDELLLVVSRSARKGNVQAQRLMWEIINTNDPLEFDDELERILRD